MENIFIQKALNKDLELAIIPCSKSRFDIGWRIVNHPNFTLLNESLTQKQAIARIKEMSEASVKITYQKPVPFEDIILGKEDWEIVNLKGKKISISIQSLREVYYELKRVGYNNYPGSGNLLNHIMIVNNEVVLDSNLSYIWEKQENYGYPMPKTIALLKKIINYINQA
jgi:hypothetical protein